MRENPVRHRRLIMRDDVTIRVAGSHVRPRACERAIFRFRFFGFDQRTKSRGNLHGRKTGSNNCEIR